MANVSILPGPQVSESAAPTPTLGENTPSEAFGASAAGKNLELTGATQSKVSDEEFAYAQNVQALYNKQASDQAGINAAKAVDQLYSTWKQNNAQGQAVANYPKLLSDIEETRSSFGQGLSPIAKSDFDELSRRFTFSTLSSASNYVADQGHQALILGADAKAKDVGQLYASNPTPDNEKLMVQLAGQSANQFFSASGLKPDDPQVRQKMLEYLSPAYATVISNRSASGDIAGAEALLDQHKNDLTTPMYAELSRGLRAADQANTTQYNVNTMYFGGSTKGTTSVAASGIGSDYVSALHGREGTAQNKYSTATGEGQFIDRTWLGVMKSDPQFANAIAGKTDAQILALRSDSSLADRAIVSYAGMNSKALAAAGLPTTEANIGLAHGFGSQGAIDILKANPSTPIGSIIGDRAAEINHLQGKTAGDVIAQFNTRFGGGQFSDGSEGVKFAPIPQPTASTDLDQWKATTEQELWKRAQETYPNNAAQAHVAFDAARQLMTMTVQEGEASQHASYDKFEGMWTSGQVQSINALKAADPTAWANLPPKYQSALENQVDSTNTLERSNNYTTELGKYNASKAYGGDPMGFGADDVRSMNLTLGQRQDLQAKQQEAKVNAAHQTQTDTFVGRAMKSIQGQAAAQALQLIPASGSSPYPDKYFQFAGALQEEVDAYESANKGQVPRDKDLDDMITRVSAKINNVPAFEVPPDQAARIQGLFQGSGLPAPSPQDIARVYMQGLRQQGVIK